MTESPEELAAVEQLLAESDALRGWLARLDTAAVAAADAVRNRVRRDYQARLDQITAGLRAHGDIIDGKLRDDRSEHAGLLARANTAREALAEAELRHLVGEYDSERFDSERTRHTSDIETYDLGLSAVAERIARLQEISVLVEGVERPLPAEPVAAASAGTPVPEVHVIGEIDAELIAIADLAPDADPEDILAIFDDTEPAADRRTATADSGPLSFRPSRTNGNGERPSSATPTRLASFESAAPLGIPAADLPPRFVRPGERIRTHSAPPAPPAIIPPTLESRAEPGVELFSEEIVATGPAPLATGTPVGRTLRCGECGAMNRPLEWYCEKCGAELTTV
ncbi:MAG: hypothetical protein ACRELE_00675 [Gemmatimonadales bacterium]